MGTIGVVEGSVRDSSSSTRRKARNRAGKENRPERLPRDFNIFLMLPSPMLENSVSDRKKLTLYVIAGFPFVKRKVSKKNGTNGHFASWLEALSIRGQQ